MLQTSESIYLDTGCNTYSTIKDDVAYRNLGNIFDSREWFRLILITLI